MRIAEGATFDDLTCPTCLVLLPPSESMRLVRDKGLIAKCDRKSLEVALAKMSDFHWCRRCHCGGLEPVDQQCTDLECDCGSTQCKLCKASGHPGLLCTEYLASDDYKCEVWKSTETKTCPTCRVAIEKNGGCNDMTCRQCKAHFCYRCGIECDAHRLEKKHYPCST